MVRRGEWSVSTRYSWPRPSAVRAMRSALDANDVSSLNEFWRDEATREPSELHGLAPISFDELLEHLPAVLDDVQVVVDNSQSTERLLYDDEVGTVVIAIGAAGTLVLGVVPGPLLDLLGRVAEFVR